ncbi:MAG: hypothetical protein KGH72_02240 [Candidatus Micrarchaeota archaeon]|nr:hypothetical protein [Candidatus Micrarchaeota archaeon]
MLEGKKEHKARSASMSEEEKKQLPIYFAITVIIILLAVFSIVLVPRGTQLQRCEGSILGRDACINNLAYSSGNASICGALSQSGADSCYYNIAINRTNATDCSRIQGGVVKSQCFYAIATGTEQAQLCQGLNQSERSMCLYTIALATSNTHACAGVPNATQQSICLATTGFDNALSRSSPAYCANMTSSTDYNLTLAMYQNENYRSNDSFNAYVSELVSYLGFSNSSVAPKDFCYMVLSAKTDNASLCARISDANISALCTATDNASRMNATARSAINYTALYLQCYNQTQSQQECNDSITYIKAVATKNASLCKGLITNESYQCYSSIAQVTNDSRICNYIKNSMEKLGCQLDIANANNLSQGN